MSDARLGELLVKQGKLIPEELRKALKMQAELGGRLGTNLLELGFASETAVLAALGELRSTRTASGAELRDAAPEVVRMIPAKLARRYRIVPYLKEGKTLFIASRDLGDALIEDEIRMLTGCMVRSCLALEVRVYQALDALYRVPCGVRYTGLAKRLDGAVPAPPRERRPAPATTPAPATPPASTPSAAPKPPSRQRPEKRHSPPPKSAAASEPEASPPPRPEPPPQPAGPLYVELDAEDAALLSQLEAGVAGDGAPGGSGDALRSALPWLTEKAPETASKTPATATVPETAAATPEEPEETAALGTVAIDLADPALPVEDRLHLAAHELQKAEIRDEIADVLLAFSAPYLERRLLLIHRKDRIVGWRGEGEGVLPESVRAIEVEDGQPSVFLSVSQSDSFWLGPLPSLPANRNLLLGLGGGQPRDCIVLPVTLRSKIVCYLYGDNRIEGVAGAPVAALRRLVTKAGIAFEVYILKNKIRMM